MKYATLLLFPLIIFLACGKVERTPDKLPATPQFRVNGPTLAPPVEIGSSPTPAPVAKPTPFESRSPLNNGAYNHKSVRRATK